MKTVAEARKGEVEKFLKQIVNLANEVSECDLVYTFFHPLLRDEQDIDKTNLQKLKGEKVTFHTHSRFVFATNISLDITFLSQRRQSRNR